MGGRVRKLRAVEDQSAPIPEERVNKLGKINLWSLPAALFGKRRVLARQGWAGEKDVILSILFGDDSYCKAMELFAVFWV
jgi:hypothetical protein